MRGLQSGLRWTHHKQETAPRRWRWRTFNDTEHLPQLLCALLPWPKHSLVAQVLGNREKSRAEHAQQTFDYKGAITWDNGLKPLRD
jgi:hypothetical protein